MTNNISKETIMRLPNYLGYLRRIKEEGGAEYISSSTVAAHFKLTPIVVKKDLSRVSANPGLPGVGFELSALIADIEKFLGYNNVKDAVIVGAGRLGSALLGFEGFSEYGINILAGIDNDEKLIGTYIDGKPVLCKDKALRLISRMNIHIGILTVPRSAAQTMCDYLVSAGIRAIWNFSSVELKVPQGVVVMNENIASTLALLSVKLQKMFDEKEEITLEYRREKI